MLRKTIFWIHLGCGVVAGLVIASMSITGVLLTYELQLLALADREYRGDPPAGLQRLPLEALIAAAARGDPQRRPDSLTIDADPAAPVSAGFGRAGSLYLNPYTGQALGDGASRLRSFFQLMTAWHRWFALEGEPRAAARAITGACNLVFLFLILSGAYLWLPRVWRWPMFRAHLLFLAHPPSSKARDYNWHHVFGIWCAIPLAVVVATAVVISYPWANDLVYRLAGEAPPAGGAPRGAPAQAGAAAPGAGAHLPLDALFARAAQQLPDWRTISLRPPASGGEAVFTIDQGNGRQPHKRHTLRLNAHTGDTIAWEPFASQSAGRRARVYIRFLHTGEALGLIGQTIAGVVSFAAVLLVWTGLALAWRRLIVPLFRPARPRA